MKVWGQGGKDIRQSSRDSVIINREIRCKKRTHINKVLLMNKLSVCRPETVNPMFPACYSRNPRKKEPSIFLSWKLLLVEAISFGIQTCVPLS